MFLKFRAAALVLFVNPALFAKEVVYTLYPPNYAATCKKYADMTESGLTVKAERLAEKYRKDHIYPVFWLKPSETKKIRLVNNSGWQPASLGADYHLRQIEDESSDYAENPHAPSSIVDIKIRKKDLESWQDLIVKWFPPPEPGERDKFKKHISEIVISVAHRDDKSRSVVSDCFNPKKKSSQLSMSGWNSVEVVLLSFKLSDRKINLDKEKSQSDSASIDDSLKSHESSTKKPDTGSPIIDNILWQQPDRYEVVRDILRREPGQANGLAMNFKFTIYQSGKGESVAELTTYAINAAIRVQDFDMVKLLVENNASMCWNAHPVSGASYCAVSYAAEFGTPEIHQYLKEQFRKAKQGSGKTALYGSDIPTVERSKACMVLADRYGYSDGAAGMSQRKAAQKICESAKEFVDLR